MIRPCPSGKIRYRDRIAAELALIGKAGEKGSVRSYRCHRCRGWHTTSQPTRKAKP